MFLKWLWPALVWAPWRGERKIQTPNYVRLAELRWVSTTGIWSLTSSTVHSEASPPWHYFPKKLNLLCPKREVEASDSTMPFWNISLFIGKLQISPQSMLLPSLFILLFFQLQTSFSKTSQSFPSPLLSSGQFPGIYYLWKDIWYDVINIVASRIKQKWRKFKLMHVLFHKWLDFQMGLAGGTF